VRTIWSTSATRPSSTLEQERINIRSRARTRPLASARPERGDPDWTPSPRSGRVQGLTCAGKVNGRATRATRRAEHAPTFGAAVRAFSRGGGTTNVLPAMGGSSIATVREGSGYRHRWPTHPNDRPSRRTDTTPAFQPILQGPSPFARTTCGCGTSHLRSPWVTTRQRHPAAPLTPAPQSTNFPRVSKLLEEWPSGLRHRF
jgi:hypothetical protein